MKTKRNTQILSAALLCTALLFFTATQADITVRIEGTDTQWKLTEAELQQAPTLQAYVDDPTKVASSTTEIVLPDNEHTQELTLVIPFLKLASQLRNGARPETDSVTAPLEFAVTMKPGSEPGSLEEKEARELLTLADAAHYWGVMPVGNIAVEHVGKRLCDTHYIQNYSRNPNATELSSTPDTRKFILEKMYQNSSAFSYWLMQDQILNNPARDGQVPTTTFNHANWVNSALFSPDGTQILTASDDNTAKLWHRGTGQLIHTFNHANWVNSALFSPDGTQILTASYDNTAKLWHRGTGQLIHTFNHANRLNSALFSPDGTQILTASWDRTAKLWNRTTGTCIHTFNHANWVNSALFSPDGTQILTASDDNTAKLWHRGTGQLIHTFNHADRVKSALFSPDSTQTLTTSHDSTAKLWNRTTGTCIHTFNHANSVNSALFSPDGTQILTASYSAAKLWNRETGHLIHTFNHAECVNSALFSPDGTQILTASGDRTAKLWNRGTRQLIHTFNHAGCIISALFSPDGTQILTASGGNTAKLWHRADPVLQKYVLQQLSLEQAAFLILAYECVQKNVPLNLRPEAQEIFEKLNPRLQDAIRSKCTGNYIKAKNILLSPHVFVSAALAAGAGVGLWWWYKK